MKISNAKLKTLSKNPSSQSTKKTNRKPLPHEIEKQIYSAWLTINGRYTADAYGLHDIANALGLSLESVTTAIKRFRYWEKKGNWEALLSVMPDDDFSFTKINNDKNLTDETGKPLKFVRAFDDGTVMPNSRLKYKQHSTPDPYISGFEDDVYARTVANKFARELMSKLTPRQVNVATRRANGEGLRDIADDIGCAHQNVCRIERKVHMCAEKLLIKNVKDYAQDYPSISTKIKRLRVIEKRLRRFSGATLDILLEEKRELLAQLQTSFQTVTDDYLGYERDKSSNPINLK